MRKAEKKDQGRVLEILTSSFETNPSVLWVIRKDSKIKKRILALCNYSYKTAFLRKGVYLSSDESGVALFYKYNIRKDGLRDYLNQAALLCNAVGISRLKLVLRREAYIKNYRPKDGEFFYFWFLGVHPNSQNGFAARELRDHLLNISDQEQLPIYLETSVGKNKKVYERYGFETYHQWHSDDKKTTVFLMRRTPLPIVQS